MASRPRPGLASCVQASVSRGNCRGSPPSEGFGQGSGCEDPQASRIVMRYPILIEEGTEDSAFGVVVPDLPGCFSAGDTLDEAVEAAKEAAAAWIDVALDQGMPVPPPSTLETVRNLRGYRGWTVGIIDLEDTFF